MPADISTALKNWSTTESSNSPSGGALVGGNLDDNLRALQVAVRALASSASVASAATVDLNAQDTATFLTVTGTSTITALGTVSAGIFKWLVFAGALTFTHNATSLILPTSASITTAAGDVALMLSLGSGNWRCLNYTRADGKPVNTTISVADGTVSAPGLVFTSDANTGLYRPSTDALAVASGGTQMALFDAVTSGILLQTPDVASGAALDITLAGGDSSSTGAAGDIYITAGAGTSSGAHGKVIITGGAGRHATNCGDVTITGGAGTTTGASGGDVTITGGSAYGSGAAAGIVYLTGGASGSAHLDGGAVSITSGDGDLGFTDAGDVVLALGRGNVASGGAVLTCDGATGHVILADGGFGAPAITSGAGTGATIAGCDSAFQVTLGTSPGTTTRVTFKTAFATAPLCFANYGASNIDVRCAPTTTYVDITFASSPAAAATVQVLCIGR